MSIPEYLPEDLVDEILCRVSATNMKRLRSTCQRWNRLYKDAWFARKHFGKSPKEFSSVIRTTNRFIRQMNVSLTSLNTVPSVEFKGELKQIDPNNPKVEKFDISKVIHCDGMLLCTSACETRFVVWNLLTGETSWITPMKGLYTRRTFAFGYCNNSKSYKILNCGYSTSDMHIYDLSSGSWRILGHDDVITPRWPLSYSHLTVSLKGSAYMFATDVPGTMTSLSLLKFDFSTEKAVTMPLPGQWNSYKSAALSLVREEKIAVLLQQEGTLKTEIWLSTKVDQAVSFLWSKILALDLNLEFDYHESFLLDEEKKVLVWATNKWLNGAMIFSDKICIVGEDSKVRQVDIGPAIIDGGWPSVHTYVPSLVRINQAGYKRKRGD